MHPGLRHAPAQSASARTRIDRHADRRATAAHLLVVEHASIRASPVGILLGLGNIATEVAQRV